MSLKTELSHVTSLIRENLPYEERLDMVGIEKLTDLIGLGYKLRTPAKSKEDGILNILKIPENRFYEWLIEQPMELREKYNACAEVESWRMQDDMLHRCAEITEEYDKMLTKIDKKEVFTRADQMRLKILRDKLAAASSTLSQLVNIQRIQPKKRPNDIPEPEPEVFEPRQPQMNVYIDGSQVSELKKLMELNKK